MSGTHTVVRFQNFLNAFVVCENNPKSPSILDVIRDPVELTLIDARSPPCREGTRPRDVMALWFSTANISRECLFLTSRMSAGITTRKPKSKMNPRMEKEKSDSSSSSARRAAGSLADGEHIPIGEHLQSSIPSRADSFSASDIRRKTKNASWTSRLSRLSTCHPTVPHTPQNSREITSCGRETSHAPL